MSPLVWIVIAALAFVGELAWLALYLASFGAAAALTAAISAFAPLPVQLIVFLLLSIVFLFGVRPLAFRVLPLGDSGGGAPQIGPLGRHGTALDQLDARGGRIRIGQGEFWSARPISGVETIPGGSEVEVEGMDGLVALVRPVRPVPTVTLPAEPEGPPFGLSPREIEVLSLVAAGLSNQEIAERLVLSPRTVHHHVTHIFAKMVVDSRVDAVRLAVRSGIVDLDAPLNGES